MALSHGSQRVQSSKGTSSALPISSAAKPVQSTKNSPSIRSIGQGQAADMAGFGVLLDIGQPAFDPTHARRLGQAAQVTRIKPRVEMIGMVITPLRGSAG
jgi:hypothetical protein